MIHPADGPPDQVVNKVREVRELLDRLEESLKGLPRSQESVGLIDAVIQLRGWMNKSISR